MFGLGVSESRDGQKTDEERRVPCYFMRQVVVTISRTQSDEDGLRQG